MLVFVMDMAADTVTAQMVNGGIWVVTTWVVVMTTMPLPLIMHFVLSPVIHIPFLTGG